MVLTLKSIHSSYLGAPLKIQPTKSKKIQSRNDFLALACGKPTVDSSDWFREPRLGCFGEWSFRVGYTSRETTLSFSVSIVPSHQYLVPNQKGFCSVPIYRRRQRIIRGRELGKSGYGIRLSSTCVLSWPFLYGGSSAFLPRHFASHGWVVAAADHPGHLLSDYGDSVENFSFYIVL